METRNGKWKDGTCRPSYIWDWIYCPLYGVAGCPFWRGYERTELYDKTIGTCEFVRYNAVSVVEGCPLSWVPL